MKRSISALWGLLTTLVVGANTARAALKVACVGDSITLGARATTPQKTYPAQLEALLGAGYQVRNFGVSGATLLKRADIPFWNTPAYPASNTYGADIVVIMLGTNDSKAPNWALRAGFAADYRAMIDHYRGLPTKPKVYAALPVPAFGSAGVGIQPTVVANEVVPAIKKAAAEAGVRVIDLFGALSNARNDFPDTVHPNDDGNEKIAAAVFAALRSEDNDGGADGGGGDGAPRGDALQSGSPDASIEAASEAASGDTPASGGGGAAGGTGQGGGSRGGGAGSPGDGGHSGNGGQLGETGPGGVSGGTGGSSGASSPSLSDVTQITGSGCAIAGGAPLPVWFGWIVLALVGLRRAQRARRRA